MRPVILAQRRARRPGATLATLSALSIGNSYRPIRTVGFITPIVFYDSAASCPQRLAALHLIAYTIT